jgi:chromosome segregation ATPase
MVRRLETEKDELQQALDEAEAALEAEESKVLRAQVEVSQIRSEVEKRIVEKEEEFENTRKNHQRALDSMQASLESEAKGRAELHRVKKNLESDINELEISLDHANKANADAQHSIKRHLEQIRELQMQVEEEQRYRDELRDSLHNCEKRAAILGVEKDELKHGLEGSDRARKQAEYEAHEARDQANELGAENSSLQGMKRKLESEMQALHADLEETLNHLRGSEERSKKAMADAARIAEELRQEQEHSIHIERMRKALEETAKAMQARLEEAEAAALRGGKKQIEKLEGRLREVEAELDVEQRRHQESVKNLAKADRRQRELQFQIDEDKKNAERLTDLCDKLQQKLKTYKRQVEEAEELANSNLSKYRQLCHQLEDAEERAEAAEQGLVKVRSKSRAGTLAPGVGNGSLAGGASFARSPSSGRIRHTASAMDLS